MGCRLLYPGFLCDVEQAARLTPKQELKGGEPGRSLGNFPDAKENVRQHLIPVPLVVSSHPTEHLLQRLIKSLDQPNGLRMVDRGSQLFNLQEATEVRHHPGHERGALVGQYLRGDADSTTKEEQLLSDGLGSGFAKGNGFRVASGVVHYHEDVFVTRADFGSGPTRSIPIRSKGTSRMGNGISGLGGGVRGDVCWHVGQA